MPQITDAQRGEALRRLISVVGINPNPFSFKLYDQLSRGIREDGTVDFERIHPVLRRTVDMVAGYIASMPAVPARQREVSE